MAFFLQSVHVTPLDNTMAAKKAAAAAAAEDKDLQLGRFKSSLSIGILGLPNVGKSTLFNLLTKSQALAANYPFATKEPNIDTCRLPPIQAHNVLVFDL